MASIDGTALPYPTLPCRTPGRVRFLLFLFFLIVKKILLQEGFIIIMEVVAYLDK